MFDYQQNCTDVSSPYQQNADLTQFCLSVSTVFISVAPPFISRRLYRWKDKRLTAPKEEERGCHER